MCNAKFRDGQKVVIIVEGFDERGIKVIPKGTVLTIDGHYHFHVVVYETNEYPGYGVQEADLRPVDEVTAESIVFAQDTISKLEKQISKEIAIEEEQLVEASHVNDAMAYYLGGWNCRHR